MLQHDLPSAAGIRGDDGFLTFLGMRLIAHRGTATRLVSDFINLERSEKAAVLADLHEHHTEQLRAMMVGAVDEMAEYFALRGVVV